MFLAFLLGVAACCVTDLDVRKSETQVIQRDDSGGRIETGRILDWLRQGQTGEPAPAARHGDAGSAPESVVEDDSPVIEIDVIPAQESGCRTGRDGFWYPGKNIDQVAGVVIKNAKRGFNFLWLMVLSIVAIPVLIFVAIVVLIFRR